MLHKIRTILTSLKFKKAVRFLFNAPALTLLSRNAFNKLPNSQLQLAEYHLIETKNFIEAYAWASVACCREVLGAYAVKKKAEENLKPEQIKVAWDKARLYKKNFL